MLAVLSSPPPGRRVPPTGPFPNRLGPRHTLTLAVAFAVALLARAPAALADDPPAPASPPLPHAILGIGDCVMLGGSQALQRAIEGIEIDAAVSRQAATGIDILRARAAEDKTEDVVIFHLGNNGVLTPTQIDDVMQALPGVPRVIFVTLTVPRGWEAPNNTVLADGVRRYPNALLADWHAVSAGRFDLLWNDGIHLRPAGADAYAALLAPLATAPLPSA